MFLKPARILLLLFIFALSFMGQVSSAVAQEKDTQEEGENRAGLVVDLGDGQVVTQCLSFSEAEISGVDLLTRSGLPFEVDVQGGIGAAVCSINGVGCAASDCFCACPGGADCVYWSYWHLFDGTWTYSAAGAGNYMVRHGDVDGWVWGPGSVSSAVPPLSTSFDAICPAVVEPTATPIPPTATPIPPTPLPPSPVPPTAAPEPKVRLAANDPVVTRGGCTMLYWEVQYVQAAYLDEVGVSGVGSREVCPQQTQNYVLRAVTDGGSNITKNVRVEVSEPTETLATATLQPAPVSAVNTLPPPLPTDTSVPVVSAVLPSVTPLPPATATPLPPPTLLPTAISTATPLPPPPTATPEVLQLPTLAPNTASATPTSTVAPSAVSATPTNEALVAAVVTPLVARSAIDGDVVDRDISFAEVRNRLSYGLFGLIVALLAGGLILMRRPK